MNTVEKVISDTEEAIRTGDETYSPPSGMQIYRSFIGPVGYTPAEYLKRRRLSVALSRIRSSEWSLADIAYACGFSDQAHYTKTFEKTMGITPLKYRKEKQL